MYCQVRLFLSLVTSSELIYVLILSLGTKQTFKLYQQLFAEVPGHFKEPKMMF
jgi:hypothetical protein